MINDRPRLCLHFFLLDFTALFITPFNLTIEDLSIPTLCIWPSCLLRRSAIICTLLWLCFQLFTDWQWPNSQDIWTWCILLYALFRYCHYLFRISYIKIRLEHSNHDRCTMHDGRLGCPMWNVKPSWSFNRQVHLYISASCGNCSSYLLRWKQNLTRSSVH